MFFPPEKKLLWYGQNLCRSSYQSFLFLSNFDQFLYFFTNILCRIVCTNNFLFDSSHYPLGTNISSYFITSKPFSNIDIYRKVAISMVSYERYFPCLILAKKIIEKLQILIWSFFPIELSFLSKNRTKFQKIESLFSVRGVKKKQKTSENLGKNILDLCNILEKFQFNTRKAVSNIESIVYELLHKLSNDLIFMILGN